MTGGKAQQTASREVQRFKVAGIVMAAIILWSSLIPLFGILLDVKLYNLSPKASQIVGKVNSNLSAKFSYSEATKTWQFNRDGLAVQAATIAEQQGGDASEVAGALKQLQQQVGGSGKDDKSLYSVNLPTDGSRAVTYYDNNTQQSFKMTPQFSLRDGKLKEGRLVYPLYGGGQLVYTAKTNGLKEDIVLEKNQGDSLDFSYSLDLPKTLEARLQDDGSVGIFSADIVLYSNISTDSDTDQAKLDSARETAPKDHLMFALPAPVIKDSEGVEKPGRFTLKDNTLTVHAKGLDKLSYPLSVDPSVVVTSSSDFATGNNEGGIAYTPSGSISATPVTGGLFDGTWTSQTNISTDTGNSHAIPRVAVYNGYLYMVNGTHVETATIDSSGVIGTWNTSPTNSNTINAHGNGSGIVAYNGYLYVVGGQGANTGVEYASIDPSTGAMGTWTSTTSLPSATFAAVTAVMNGYLYVAGGYGGSTLSTVRYAKINANGTIGSWAATTSLPQVRTTGSGFSYNGYLYVGGGYVDENNTLYSSVIYAKQNSDGTLGSWTTTSSMSQAGPGLAMTVVGSYAYAFGGAATTTYGNGSTRAEYAQINADGSLGPWRTNSSMTLTQARTNLGAFSYANGTDSYVYVLGGRDQASGGYRNTVHSAKIAKAGATASRTTNANNLGTSRMGACTAAYNGYMYTIGGETGAVGSGGLTTVEYASINATTAAIGSSSTTTALPSGQGRAQFGCTAHSGYLYVAGADYWDTAVSGSTYYIAINSNGTLGASWTAGTTLAGGAGTARNDVFAYTAEDGTTRLYTIGIVDASNGNPIIQMATLNTTTGAIGSWSTLTNTGWNGTGHTRGTFGHSGKYVYAMGGNDGATVEYASIQSNGTLSSWTSTTVVPDGISYASTTTVNGCIYVIGGSEDGTVTSYSSDVFFACPSSSGSIAQWNTATSLGTARNLAAAVSYNGYVYDVGGNTGSAVNTIAYAKVNNGGSGYADTWSSSATSGPVGSSGASMSNSGGYLYLTGGADGSSQRDWTAYGQIGVDGSVTFTSGSTMTIPRAYHGMAVYNGYIYAVGGSTTGWSPQSSVEYAQIQSNGSIGTWATTTSMPEARYSAKTIIHNGYIYVIGGGNASFTLQNTVYYAPINSNGTVGSWSTTSTFTNARVNMAAFAYGGYMYMSGGYDGNSSGTYYKDVQYAPINSNGTLGSWSYTSAPSAASRAALYMHASDGFVYWGGGSATVDSSNVAFSDMYRAPMLANGQVGPWEMTTSMGTGTFAGASDIANGQMYVYGGRNSGGNTSSLQRTLLDAVTHKARYSKRVTLPVQAGTVTVNYGGTFTSDTEVRFATASTNNVFGSLTKGSASVGSDPGGSCLIPTINTVWLTATIDDSHWSTFGGGSTSSISDISVFYSDVARPTPNQRLFGGKWFKNEVLQGLDVCGNV